MKSQFLWSPLLLALLAPSPVAAQATPDQARYEPRFQYPVLKKLRGRDKNRGEVEATKTKIIRKKQKSAAAKKRKARKVMVATLPAARRPSSPAKFKQLWHHKPVAQFMTGTCWSFSATSMLESEVFRLQRKKIKLSEMHTVYYEYLEKARRYVRQRGKSRFSQGSEDNAVTRIWKRYGAVPRSVYAGVLARDKMHDHSAMMRQMKAVLAMVKKQGLWDENTRKKY